MSIENLLLKEENKKYQNTTKIRARLKKERDIELSETVIRCYRSGDYTVMKSGHRVHEKPYKLWLIPNQNYTGAVLHINSGQLLSEAHKLKKTKGKFWYEYDDSFLVAYDEGEQGETRAVGDIAEKLTALDQEFQVW